MPKEVNKNMSIAISLLIPFLGTMLGSAMVFFMKDKIEPPVLIPYYI